MGHIRVNNPPPVKVGNITFQPNMTIVVVILVGAGILLISSGIDCTPIVDTFTKIVKGEKLNFTGDACAQTIAGTPSNVPNLQTPPGYCPKKSCRGDPAKPTNSIWPIMASDAGGCCPDGYFRVALGLGCDDNAPSVCQKNFTIKIG